MCGFTMSCRCRTPRALEARLSRKILRDEKPTFLAHAGEDQDWAELAQNDRLDIFERLLPPDRRRLLDIGCGPGIFLQTAKARGWLALGIEPSRQAATHARSLGSKWPKDSSTRRRRQGWAVSTRSTEQCAGTRSRSGRNCCCWRAELLEPGGVICVNVPNDYSPLQIAARAATAPTEWWVSPKHHLNYFDFDSLSGLLTRLGFASPKRSTSFPMEPS